MSGSDRLPGTVGVLHPGAMGATVGAALVAAGRRVLWVSQGRSEATHKRAAQVRLEDAGSLAGLVRASEMIVSVCPPASAEDVARDVAGLGFAGLYVDANAVAPATAARIEAAVRAAGARFVDGGIIGPPAVRRGTTRLYVSGPGSDQVVACFAGGALDARVLEDSAGSASALKMAYAAYSKGQTALLAAVHALARHEGVYGALLAEWELSQPDLAGRSAASIPGAAPRAWRWAPEMEEIARTFRGAGLPGEFHDAAAEIYRRLAEFKDAPPPALEAVADALVRPRRA